jgi:type II secretory ATPase GspE/PulE/Tfp pilus assembly ATPase PilB-like protein
VDLGVKTATIGPALNLIIAQRLVRKLCEKCKKQKKSSEDELKKIKEAVLKISTRVDKKPYENFVIYEAVGCTVCNGFGYKGRIGIFEFLETGPEFEEVILKEASEVALKRFAVAQGMVTMQQDGILKVLKGITTLEEVEKVTGAVEL